MEDIDTELSVNLLLTTASASSEQKTSHSLKNLAEISFYCIKGCSAMVFALVQNIVGCFVIAVSTKDIFLSVEFDNS